MSQLEAPHDVDSRTAHVLLPTRRDILRVGTAGILGLPFCGLLGGESGPVRTSAVGVGSNGWRTAKSVILVFLQGGPSHIDLWDPKPDAPAEVRSAFKSIRTSVPGVHFTELLPHLARVNNCLTLIRSMSYEPNGLFNHAAGVYEVMTGHAPRDAHPSGQLAPADRGDHANLGSQIVRLQCARRSTVPFVMLPRPLQEGSIIDKGGSAGYLGGSFDPHTVYIDDCDVPNRSASSAISMGTEVSDLCSYSGMGLRNSLNQQVPSIAHSMTEETGDERFRWTVDSLTASHARDAFDLSREPERLRDRYGRNTFGQSCLLARRLIEAGTLVVQINWPSIASSDKQSWDHHAHLTSRLRDCAPTLDSGLASLVEDLDVRGHLDSTLIVCIGEFGRSPRRGISTSGHWNGADGRDHWPYCFTAIIAGAGVKRGYVHGQSDATGSSPLEQAVHPTQLLASIYHALGIDPTTTIHDHLEKPYPLVKGVPVAGLFA